MKVVTKYTSTESNRFPNERRLKTREAGSEAKTVSNNGRNIE